MAARLSAIIVTVIVGATLIAGLIVGAQRDDADGPVDLIIHNARVYTGAGSEVAEAVAVRGNQILLVGSNREVWRLRRPQTTMIDAEGGTVVPGFNDTQVSLIQGGLSQQDAIDASGAATIEDLTQLLTEEAGADTSRPWVVARAWRCPATGTIVPRVLLDRVVPDRPAAVACLDGRTVWANSAALGAAGITRRTPGPQVGSIEARGSEPNGVLRESARALLAAAMPPPTAADRLRAVRAATAFAHSQGVTSVHDIGATPDSIGIYEGLRRAGDLKLRIYAIMPVTARVSPDELATLAATREKHLDDPLLRAGAVHLVVDAVPPPGRGPAGTSRTETPKSTESPDLERTIVALDAQGWQIVAEASHADTVSRVLDAFEAAARANKAPERGRRHRIARIDTLDAADAGRLRALDMTAALVPARVTWTEGDLLTGPPAEPLTPPVRPWVTLHDAHASIAFGSDWPVVPIDPVRALLFAASPDGLAANAPGDDASSAFGLPQAIDAYTSAGAHASFDDHRKGRLAVGMLADLVILSKDIFAADRSGTTVDVTVFDGKVVYRRAADTTH